MPTYEGGIGGEPGNEAHGGYTYCGLAALMLVGKADVLNLPRLLHFAVRCQANHLPFTSRLLSRDACSQVSPGFKRESPVVGENPGDSIW